MNNKAKTSKAVVTGVVGLAAGLAATAVLVGELAAATPDSKPAEGQEPAAQHYTGPRTADGAEHWLGPEPAYTGPMSADAAEGWFESGSKNRGPANLDTECWFESGSKYRGPTTPDAADHWFKAYREAC